MRGKLRFISDRYEIGLALPCFYYSRPKIIKIARKTQGLVFHFNCTIYISYLFIHNLDLWLSINQLLCSATPNKTNLEQKETRRYSRDIQYEYKSPWMGLLHAKKTLWSWLWFSSDYHWMLCFVLSHCLWLYVRAGVILRYDLAIPEYLRLYIWPYEWKAKSKDQLSCEATHIDFSSWKVITLYSGILQPRIDHLDCHWLFAVACFGVCSCF